MPIRTEVSQLFWQSLVDQHNQTIQLNPNDASVYVSRGGTYSLLGQKENAIANFQYAARLFQLQGDRARYQRVMDALRHFQQQ
jgi:regulator of sirC expression with transglutaminase-like and TPR domain